MLSGSRWWVVLFSAALMLMSTGCGEDVTCGENTEKDGDACVIASTVCGEGTALEGTRCVPAATACDAGTTLVNGLCVADEMCGAGTSVNTDGECVPDALVGCGTGTLDDGNGVCFPDFTVVCGAGTVTLDGICVTPVEALRGQNPTLEIEPNDPFVAGVGTPITLPEVGEDALLNGTVGAPDAEGNSDWDGYAFTTTAGGQVLFVEAISAGLPKPYFVILGDLDDDPTTFEYSRSGPSGAGANPGREVVLPAAGDYLLFVTDYDNASGEAVGGDGFEYFVRIERRPDIDISSLNPTAAGVAGFAVDPEDMATVADKVIHLVPESAGKNSVLIDRTAFDNSYAFQTLMVFDDQLNFLREEPFVTCIDGLFGPECFLRGPFAIDVPDAGYILILDYESSSGEAILPAEVETMTTPELPSDKEGTFDNAGSELYVLTVPAGLILQVELEGGADVTPFVLLADDQGEPLTTADADAGGKARLVWYFESEREVQVTIADGTADDPEGTDYAYTLAVDTIPATVLSALDPANSVTSVTDSSIALNAAGKDVDWAVVPVIPDGFGELALSVKDSAAEVGFTAYAQTADAIEEVDVAFPESGEALLSTLTSDEATMLIELVAITGESTGVEITATWTPPTTYTSEGNTCAAPIALTGNSNFVVELESYTNDIDGANVFGLCGDGSFEEYAQGGPDAFATITVPAGNILEVETGGSGVADDTVLALLRNDANLCTNLGTDSEAFECLAYDDDSGDAFLSMLNWENTESTDVEVVIVLDNYTPDLSDSETATAEDANTVFIRLVAP